MDDKSTREAVESALAKLDLATKVRLLQGQDIWTLPPLPEIGLGSIVMSDGPVGVRGATWGPEDPSVLLPSPTAMAASWDPELIERAGALLAQEARRKGVHLLLAPTVNMHRTPVGGRHFEAYSEDPLLTGVIGAGFVRGVQSGGVGATVKHFVANDAETDRMSVDNLVSPEALRELYLAPFEAIVRDAAPWAIMSAYNGVNGTAMSEHAELLKGVLRDEWGFDGIVVSDWFGTRSTVGAIRGGLDVAMPGPVSVYGDLLVKAVQDGDVEESAVDDAVRHVLLLAARVGLLEGAEPAVAELPAHVDGRQIASEVARRSFVLVRNTPAGADAPVLPIAPESSVALIGLAARDARVLGGGSAMVFPERIVSPLDGLTSAIPGLSHSVGTVLSEDMGVADRGFDLVARCLSADGGLQRELPLADGAIMWMGDLPEGVDYPSLQTIEIRGSFTPERSGPHRFGTKGIGQFTMIIDGETVFEGEQTLESFDPFEMLFGAPKDRAVVELEAGRAVDVVLRYAPMKIEGSPVAIVSFALGHLEPQRDPEELLEEAVAAATAADIAVVVVATTDKVESEGFDRTTLTLPGRQDELVARVAAANPRTVVVVNSGAPVEMPWREDVAAVLLTWFPGQEAGAALAEVLTGAAEPGGRLPTTWPAALADCPVTAVAPVDGTLSYDEGLFIGYRAWDRLDVAPAYPFGHGLGYTSWEYAGADWDPAAAAMTVRVTNTGPRAGREVVQAYIAPVTADPARPARALAGFATVEAGPGESVTTAITLPRRAFEVWDEARRAWAFRPGAYDVRIGSSSADTPLTVRIDAAG